VCEVYNVILPSYRNINLQVVVAKDASEIRPARHTFPATEKVYSSPCRYIHINMNLFVYIIDYSVDSYCILTGSKQRKSIKTCSAASLATLETINNNDLDFDYQPNVCLYFRSFDLSDTAAFAVQIT